MPVFYEKDNKQYYAGPITYLNGHFAHDPRRGDRLQEFFNKIGFDFDLSSGTGSAKYDIFGFDIGERYGDVAGFGPIFHKTDYERNQMTHMRYNPGRNDKFRNGYTSSPLTSAVLIFHNGEKYPRFLYHDEKGEPQLSETLNKITLETYKPKEPSGWAKFWHKISSSLYKKEFEDYESNMNKYRYFSRNFEKIRSFIEPMAESHTKFKQEEANEIANLKFKPNLEKMMTELDARIDDVLGPEPQDKPWLYKNDMLKPGELDVTPIEYPEDVAFTNHEIGLIGYALLSNPSVAILRGTNQFWENQNDNVFIHNTHLTDDIFFYGNERANSNANLESYKQARLITKALIDEYMKGNKEPLAKELGNALKFQLGVEASMGEVSNLLVAKVDNLRKTFDILKKDPELIAKSGLTKENIVELNGRIAQVDLYKNYLDAQESILDCSKHMRTMSQETKEKYITDMLLSKMYSQECRDAIDEASASPEFVENMMNYTQVIGERAAILGQIRDEKEKKNPDQQLINNLNGQIDLINLKIEASNTISVKIQQSTKTPSIVKLLGADDENGTQKKAFIEKIKQTDTFKTYANKTVDELASIIKSNSLPENEMDKKTNTIKQEIIVNEAKKAEEINNPQNEVVLENQHGGMGEKQIEGMSEKQAEI